MRSFSVSGLQISVIGWLTDAIAETINPATADKHVCSPNGAQLEPGTAVLAVTDVFEGDSPRIHCAQFWWNNKIEEAVGMPLKADA